MLERKIIGMPPAERLGILRAIIVFPLILYVLWIDFPSFSEVPISWYRPIGFMLFVPKSLTVFLLHSSLTLWLYKIILLIFLTSAMVGYRTRLSLTVSSVLFFIFAGIIRAYAWFFHTSLIPFLLMFTMIWLPAGEGFSIDAKLRKAPPDSRPSLTMGWSVFLLRAILAGSYFQAGFAKLHNSGWEWMAPWNLKYHVLESSLTEMHFDFGLGLKMVTLPDAVWGVLAVAALFSELLYPLVLFSWHLRMIYPLVGIFLHTFILLMQNIFFPDLIILQLIFYDWDRILIRHPSIQTTRHSRAGLGGNQRT